MIVDLKNKLPEELENLSAADFVMVQEGEQIMDEKFQTKPIGFFKDALIRLCRSKVAVVSFTMIMLIILGALFVPVISGYGYNEQDINKANLPPRIPVLCACSGVSCPCPEYGGSSGAYCLPARPCRDSWRRCRRSEARSAGKSARCRPLP